MKNENPHQLPEVAVIEATRTKLQSMAQFLKSVGISVKPWTSPDLQVLQKLSIDKQLEILHDLTDRVEFLSGAQKEGLSLLDTRQLLWRSLKRFGWTPQPDLFNYISDEDTVEVYRTDQRQTFRNFEFFRYISFTLEELHARPWYQLTRRDPQIAQQLYDAAMSIISGGTKETLHLGFIPEHPVHEVDSELLRKFTIEMRCISPIFNDGELVALVSVNRTRFL